MQEVIRLELCGVTRGRGGMVSLRGVRHVVTPRKAGRGLLLSLGGSWQGWQVNTSAYFLSSEGRPPVVECSSSSQNVLNPPRRLTTGWLCLAFSMRERGFNSPWSIFSIPCVKQADVWSFLFRDGRLLLSEGDQCSLPSVRLETHGFWRVADAIPARLQAPEICVPPRPLLSC